MSAGERQPQSYSIDDVIRVPIRLRDEDGIAQVRAVFKRLRYSGGLGPRGLDPEHVLELRGNGRGEKEATVEVSVKVSEEHAPGEYLCVAIQVYDSQGNAVTIENPTPWKIVKIVDEGKRDEKKTEFLGWGD